MYVLHIENKNATASIMNIYCHKYSLTSSLFAGSQQKNNTKDGDTELKLKYKIILQTCGWCCTGWWRQGSWKISWKRKEKYSVHVYQKYNSTS